MDDLAICNRIAEIEGVECCVVVDELFVINKRSMSYNPLTDDAFCFKLMVKHKITFAPCSVYKNMFLAFGIGFDGFRVLPKIHENTPNKAICLAIIEAHKD